MYTRKEPFKMNQFCEGVSLEFTKIKAEMTFGQGGEKSETSQLKEGKKKKKQITKEEAKEAN